jgi:hypothetical protein
MRSQALKKHDHHDEQEASWVERRRMIKILPVQAVQQEGMVSIDYEAFMMQYGLWSDFA